MNLNQRIISLLNRKKLKLAVAESCTGGMLASSLTSVSGASKVFSVGLITYSNQSKINILKIPKKIIQKHGAVSVQCCLSMVNNLSKISKSKICISITGVAGPKGGTAKKPVGLVYIGLKNGKKILVSKNKFRNKGRFAIQTATVKKALNLIFKQF